MREAVKVRVNQIMVEARGLTGKIDLTLRAQVQRATSQWMRELTPFAYDPSHELGQICAELSL